DLLTFLCAICVAVHIIVADTFLKQSNPILLGVGQIVAAFILSFLAWTVQSPTSFMTVTYTPALILAVVLTAVFCTCFAFTGQIVVQKHLPPARVAVIFTLEPVFAYLYALVIPGPGGMTEALTWFNVLGSLLIVGGMIISESGILNRKQ
ncbi:MAG: EamA family transporter, partial [Clostridia bacterium]|nr:EamA family transporter [Clostridia bacterium]